MSNDSILTFDSLSFLDIHYHADPDLYYRRNDALSAGRHYRAQKGGVVLKSHLGATTLHATLAQRAGLPVFPSVVLNYINGGISFLSILRALAEYNPVIPSRVIIHFPTITGREHTSVLSRKLTHTELSEFTLRSETLFNSSQKLRPEVIDILKMSRDYPIILSTGHASKKEVYALIDAAIQFNIPYLLLNQPANPLTGFTAEELIALEDHSFIWVEQTALTYLLKYQSKQDFEKVMKNVKNLIYSSDLGQTSQMDIEAWLSSSKNWFHEFNLSIDRQEKICLKNPLTILKI